MKFSLRFLFSSRGKYALLFLGMSIVWLSLCFPLLSSIPNTDIFGKGCAVVVSLAIEGVIISGIYDYEQRWQRRKTLQRSRENDAHFYKHLLQLPNFSLDYWCVLPTPLGEETRAVAVDTSATQIALVDYTNSKNRRDTTPLFTTKIVKAGDVVNVALEESSALSSPTLWTKLVEGEAKVRCASYFRRADGTLPSLEKDPQLRKGSGVVCPESPPIPNPTQSQEWREIELYLKLTLRNAQNSVEHLDFFAGEVDSSDTRYNSARRRAEHWQALFEGFKAR